MTQTTTTTTRRTLTAWLRESNRWKHLTGGFIIGLLAGGWYGALYTGAAVGAALEFKDRQWGGRWDWTDLALTVAGAAIGQLTASLLWKS